MLAAVEFGILGPLEVRLAGEPVVLGGPRQRALLAVLALHANEVVSTDRLVDQLWPEPPPATAVHTVQVFVSRLRAALGAVGDRLVTRSPGYVLAVGVDELDSGRYERLCAEGRTALAGGDHQRAVALLREGEALWRGPALAEFTYEPFAQSAIARLEEMRASCREELVEAELALGRHAAMVSDLEALVREHPFRERLRGQLMVALYRCGRQTEALEAFRQARRMLVEELALEPSAALRELEQAILRQDPALLVPRTAPASPSPAASGPPGSPSSPTKASTLPTAASPPPSADSPPPTTGGPPPASPPPAAEPPTVRRTVTVLAGILTPRGQAGQADPETTQGLMGMAREQAKEIVGRHGGTVLAGLVAEVVGVFGIAQAEEDDALRALRAADEWRAWVAAPVDGEPAQLAVRVGVDTGEVVGRSPADLYGSPLERAVTFAHAAEQGEVLLSEATRRLAVDAIRAERASAGGSEWRLLATIAGARALARALDSPMVGRTAELALGLAALDRCARSRETQLLSVIGDAGIGKSRLVGELCDQLAERATILTGHCLSYGEGIAFWPLLEALTRAAGDESRDAIRALLDGPDADEVADVVAAALGVTQSQDVAERVPWAFRRLLEMLARDGELVLVIEDAHWAEAPLLELLDHCVEWPTAPALLVCTARPELLDVRPRWGGGHARVSSLVLEPLGDEDALRLLEAQLGEQSLAAEVKAEILRTAEGNPLFVEQLLAMNREDPWDVRERRGERRVPASLQSLLAARLDRLGPGERAFTVRAAIIGREFPSQAVVELLPEEARAGAAQHIRAVVRRGLIEPHRGTPSGEETLRFHHILIRDIAYASTSKALRGELHERFADWLVTRGDAHDEFVGHHLEQAFVYRRERNGRDEGLPGVAVRAAEHLATAGERALGRGDAPAATTLLGRCDELYQFASGHDAERVAVLLELGRALERTAEFGLARTAEDSAMELAEALGDERACARCEAGLAELARRQNRFDEATDRLARAGAAFRTLGDEAGLGQVLHVERTLAAQRGDFAQARSYYGESLVIRRRLGDLRMVASLISNLGIVAENEGDYVLARSLNEEALELRTAFADRWGISVSLTNLGMIATHEGRNEEARSRFEEAIRLKREVGDSSGVMINLNNLGNANRDLGDYAAARAHYAECMRAQRELEDGWGLAFLLEDVGRLAALTGDPRLALELVGAADALREQLGAPRAASLESEIAEVIEPAAERLAAAEREAARARGRGLDRDRAIAAALSIA